MDRSFTLVGNLASVECNDTRNYPHKYNKSPDLFCFVCGEYGIPECLRSFSDSFKSNYNECFGVAVANQNETWVPQKVCNRCYTMLTRWQKNKQQQNLKFTNPMKWSAPTSQMTATSV